MARRSWDDDWDDDLYSELGILLEVRVVEQKSFDRWAVPWVYRVLWQDGIIAEHEMGTLRRLVVKR